MGLTTNSEDYIFIPEASEYEKADTVPIRIIKGQYAGVDFRFDRVSLTPKGEELNINFDVDLLKVPETLNVTLKDQEFVDFLGQILYDILVNRDDINASVSDDAEPVDLEADVHEEPNGKDHS